VISAGRGASSLMPGGQRGGSRPRADIAV